MIVEVIAWRLHLEPIALRLVIAWRLHLEPLALRLVVAWRLRLAALRGEDASPTLGAVGSR